MNSQINAETSKLKMGSPNLEVFSNTLQNLAAEDRNLVVVTSDSRGSGKLVPFGEKFPKQIVEVGIAEQNLVGIAAGLASTGKKVFAVSPACFLTARSFEQIKNDVAYSDNPVNLIGISAGVSYGALGTTHHSLHDFAALRAVNNITIVAPADNFETEMAIRFAAHSPQPFYIRFGKKNMPFISENKDFEIGKGRLVRNGKAAVIVATGETVYPALLAADHLEKTKGIRVAVVSMHTLKPLDTKLLTDLAGQFPVMLTVEEHMVNGGLGEACSGFLLQNGFAPKFKILGIPDEYTVTGSQLEIFDHYGISEKGIASEVLKMIDN
ncbi:transketolase family protein [Pararhodonellum marinum]|uniref:transketolase family protein n=1 Tax=Pararhodonellum marinum TaxID=2755358 RepID=UPI00188FD9A9|nr:transketolase C-terminal domain-containing protein [Pararhodonellum marinum]